MPASLPQDPFSNVIDQPGFLCKGNELPGHHGSTLFRHPSNQRFKRDDFPGVEIDLWLIYQCEIAILHCRPQIGFQGRTAFDGDVHLWGEKLIGVLPQGFAVEHRGIGILEQCRWIAAIVGIKRNTDRARDMLVRPAQLERQTQRIEDLLCHTRCTLVAFQLVEQHNKFISALTGDGVMRANRVD